jgi:hypothetical protein
VTEQDLGDYDEFGLVVPFDIGERAALTGYNNASAFLPLNGDHTEHDTRWPTVNLADPAYAIPPPPPPHTRDAWRFAGGRR